MHSCLACKGHEGGGKKKNFTECSALYKHTSNKTSHKKYIYFLLLVSSGPTGTYNTETGADATPATKTATEDAEVTDPPPPTTPHAAPEGADTTAPSTEVGTQGSTAEHGPSTDTWTAFSEPITSTPVVETAAPTEEAWTTASPAAEESTTAAAAPTEDSTSPAPPEESTTPAEEAETLTDPVEEEVQTDVVEKSITREEVTVEESSEGEERIS